MPQHDSDWETLTIHNNDDTLNEEWAVHTWDVSGSKPYRYFRIINVGPTNFVDTADIGDWSQTLVVGKFELYGSLLKADTIPISSFESTKPITYGKSQTNNYKPIETVRANRRTAKEIREILTFISKPYNESKAEKVQVHEIYTKQNEPVPNLCKPFKWSDQTQAKGLDLSQKMLKVTRNSTEIGTWQVM